MDYRKLAEKFMFDSFCKVPPFTPPDDMSKGEVGILTYLTFFNDGVLSGELASKLSLSSGRIAIALNGLEKKKYIIRSTDSSDRRKVIVKATKEGKIHATEQKEKALNDFVRIFEFIGEKDSTELVRILYRIFDIK